MRHIGTHIEKVLHQKICQGLNHSQTVWLPIYPSCDSSINFFLCVWAKLSIFLPGLSVFSLHTHGFQKLVSSDRFKIKLDWAPRVNYNTVHEFNIKSVLREKERGKKKKIEPVQVFWLLCGPDIPELVFPQDFCQHRHLEKSYPAENIYSKFVSLWVLNREIYISRAKMLIFAPICSWTLKSV